MATNFLTWASFFLVSLTKSSSRGDLNTPQLILPTLSAFLSLVLLQSAEETAEQGVTNFLI